MVARSSSATAGRQPGQNCFFYKTVLTRFFAPTIVHFAGFAGGHIDSNTGLVNDYHRWYDPATGRWLNEDPLAFTAGDENLTRYVGNNPTGLVDPTGLSPINQNQQQQNDWWLQVILAQAQQALDQEVADVMMGATYQAIQQQIKQQVQAKGGWTPPGDPQILANITAAQLAIFQIKAEKLAEKQKLKDLQIYLKALTAARVAAAKAQADANQQAIQLNNPNQKQLEAAAAAQTEVMLQAAADAVQQAITMQKAKANQ